MTSDNDSTTNNNNTDSTHESYISSAMSYINTSANAIANTVVQTVKEQTHTNNNNNNVLYKRILSGKQYILYKSFQTINVNNTFYKYLILGLVDGLQVYYIKDEYDIRLVCSYTDTNNRCSYNNIKILPHIYSTITVNDQQAIQQYDDNKSQCTGCQHQLLLLVTSAIDTEQFTRKQVKVFSIQQQQFVNTLTFNSRIYSVDISDSVFSVSLENEIYVYKNPVQHCTATMKYSHKVTNELSFQLLHTLSCYHNQKYTSVVALGLRWIAYTTTNTDNSNDSNTINTLSNRSSPNMSPTINSVDASHCNNSPALRSTITNSPKLQSTVTNSNNNNNSIVSSIPSLTSLTSSIDHSSVGNAVKSVATSLYNITGYSKQKVTEYINSNLQHTNNNITAQHTNEHTQSDAGTVVIRDLYTNKIITSFKHFDQRIVALSFDHSGTLLCAAPSDGQYIYVYQISINHVTLLYRLFRGIQHAIIRDMAFSYDNKWITLSSTNGTTHIYAINRNGGKVLYHTHNNRSNNSLTTQTIRSNHIECHTINARYRIKHVTSVDYIINDSDIATKYITTSTPIINDFLYNTDNLVDSLLIMSETDELTVHKIKPIPSTKSIHTQISINTAQTVLNNIVKSHSPNLNDHTHSVDNHNNNNNTVVNGYTKLAVDAKLLANYDLSQANNNMLLQYKTDKLQTNITMTTDHFNTLQQSRFILPKTSQQPLHIQRQLQHSYWLSQAELHIKSNTMFVPIHISPIFKLYNYVDDNHTKHDDKDKIEVINNKQVIALNCDNKYNNAIHNNGILSDKVVDALNTNVNNNIYRYNKSHNTNDVALFSSPLSSTFSPSANVYHRELLNDQLDLNNTDMINSELNELTIVNGHFD